MALKIKWNDDRVRGATTAILLIGRERLQRGETDDLVAASLAEYRADPEGYKLRKPTWADAREPGPLTKSAHVAYYKNLISAIDALLKKMEQGKRQSNSLLELDNYLIACLRDVR
jgi:hypothetical protein